MHDNPIRSYVIRGKRMTPAQRRALNQFWQNYALESNGAPLDLYEIFGRTAPLTVEIGSGDGRLITALARANPQTDFIAIEVYKPGIGRMLNQADNLGINNLRVICDDAISVIARYFPPRSIDQTLIMFPDPWHKKRHHKRRLIRPDFMCDLARAMKRGSLLYLATDWLHYTSAMRSVIETTQYYKRCDVVSWEHPHTTFQIRAKKAGRPIFNLAYRVI